MRCTAVADVFSLLQSCIGLEIDAPRSKVSFRYPVLPKSLREVRINNLQVGAASTCCSSATNQRGHVNATGSLGMIRNQANSLRLQLRGFTVVVTHVQASFRDAGPSERNGTQQV